MQRLKDFGLTNFLCVFVGEDRGHTTTPGELWDLVLSTKHHGRDSNGRRRSATCPPPTKAACRCGVGRRSSRKACSARFCEAQAMARPVVVSDLGAGPDVVLTAPGVPESRITGLRFHSGDDRALAAALLQLFSMPEPAIEAIGRRGRDWVIGHFNAGYRRRADDCALRRTGRPAPKRRFWCPNRTESPHFE